MAEAAINALRGKTEPQPLSSFKTSPTLSRPTFAAEPESEVQPLSSFKTSPMLARPKARATGQLCNAQRDDRQSAATASDHSDEDAAAITFKCHYSRGK